MNELTWRRVLEWEALHHDTCGDPKLLRFMGKPHDLRYESSTVLLLTQVTLVRLWHCAFMAVLSLQQIEKMSNEQCLNKPPGVVSYASVLLSPCIHVAPSHKPCDICAVPWRS